jgi:hypothetical protein
MTNQSQINCDVSASNNTMKRRMYVLILNTPAKQKYAMTTNCWYSIIPWKRKRCVSYYYNKNTEKAFHVKLG